MISFARNILVGVALSALLGSEVLAETSRAPDGTSRASGADEEPAPAEKPPIDIISGSSELRRELSAKNIDRLCHIDLPPWRARIAPALLTVAVVVLRLL